MGMKMGHRIGFALVSAAIVLAYAGSGHAQSAQTLTAAGQGDSMQTAVVAAPVAQTGAMLRAGTSVPLRTIVELTTNGKRLKVGHRFELETTEAVTLSGVTVIPVGSRAIGEVTHVRNKGMWGKSGAVEARMLYVSVNGRNMRLSGTIDDKGVTGTAGVVGAIAVLPVAGFFMTGTSAVLPSGTMVRAFLEEDVPVTFETVPVTNQNAVVIPAERTGAATMQTVSAPNAPR